MKFRTELRVTKSAEPLDTKRPLVLLGSCFTDNIGGKMRDCRWEVYPNLCGTLFNPASIANIVRLTLNEKNREKQISESVAERDGLYMSWLTDSKCSARSRENTVALLAGRVGELHRQLLSAQALIVTFGTAWIYGLRERSEYVVSNCHKFPADTFIRRRLDLNEIVADWTEIIDQLRVINPDIRIIFTVSPVRHLKDGFEGNSRSKAILQLACEELCRVNTGAEYFPAFEIMNDDLRDYRFYAADLVHPSEQAVEYIWEKFQERYLSEESRRHLEEGLKITRRLNHRPILPAD